MSLTHYNKVVLSPLREQVFLQRIIGLQGKYRLIQCIFLNCTWGSGPLLRMACTSPISFNWFLCTITEEIGVSTVVGISMDILVFLCCFQLQKQENLHKPFEWHSKINTKHTYTAAHLHFPLIIKLLHTPLRLVFSLCNSTND
jgi:hypothetical protein